VVSFLAISCCAAGAEPAGRSLDPPVFLPDGREFTTWEQPIRFTNTLHVARNHPKADDANPGTEALPFKTIGAAAKAAQPGERVLVHEGVYRECVCPARGGSGPHAMIGYEAAEGESVTIKGSEVADPAKWQPSSLDPKSDGGKAAFRVWMIPLDKSLLPGGNPFASINMKGKKYGFWFPAYTLRRGLVFQDGRRLEQVHTSEELKGGPGRYWVEGEAVNANPSEDPAAPRPKPPEVYFLHVRPRGDTEPARSFFEITAREHGFAPEDTHLGYIRVKGFTLEQFGNRFPRPQYGALSAARGHHWIIEDNTVRWANAIGIDAGLNSRGRGRKDKDALCGYNIVRRNTVTDCGICGIAADQGADKGLRALRGALVEDNRILRTGWHGCEALMENAAIKMHTVHDSVVQRNFIADTHQASGIWLDWMNVNSRVTRNAILNTGTVRAAIFVEASLTTNAVDNNLVVDCRISRNPEFYPRETGGFGVLTTESRHLIVAHNLFAGCLGAGVNLGLGDTNRFVSGQPPASHGHVVTGNVFVDCATPVMLPNVTNSCDHNVYGGGGTNMVWRIERPERRAGFQEWRQELGFDVHGCLAGIGAEIDRPSGTLRMTGVAELPATPRPGFVTRDLLGVERTGETAVAGPFAEPAKGRFDVCVPREEDGQSGVGGGGTQSGAESNGKEGRSNVQE
jgi:hypothetical protein